MTTTDWTAIRAVDPTSWAQARTPLGAQWRDGHVTFAVYSKHATRMVVELFDHPWGECARATFVLARGTDDIFRGIIEGLAHGTLYGIRCWGPNWTYARAWTPGSIAGFLADVDRAGHRFNPNKLLIDPYARELSHDRENPALRALGHHAEMYGSGPGLYAGFGQPPVVRRVFDTGPWAPKSVVVVDSTAFGAKPRIHQKDAIIYEAHLRGLTKHPSASRLSTILAGIDGFEGVRDIPEPYRGTYLGAGMMAPYLAGLGITTIELLPVHETANDLNTQDFDPDRTPHEAPHGNYWGYMTYGYFAPDRRYAYDRSPGGPTREFKEMVRAFHEVGIEVYLDVVYNHSAEGGVWDEHALHAEILLFRGLDNASYYALCGEGKRHYWQSTGCGNNMDCSQPVVQRLISDSLHYWSCEMGVDGFRFDLATVLGRDALLDYAFCGHSDFLHRIAAMAEAQDIEVIAEAWDTAAYSVGAFPPGWAEWNGRYRDVVRRFLRGDPGLVRSFAEVVNGDYLSFGDQGGPHKAVNFIVAHDGFTLLDLVSYNHKNNLQAWPFGPSDGGTDDNASWDSGGDHGLRRQRMRNFLVIQIFSRGVPMLVGGDEYGRTQNGNNNPYKLDSVGTWQNYAAIATNAPTAIPTEGPGAYHDNFGRHGGRAGYNGWFAFVRRLLRLRRDHVGLRQDRYGDFSANAGENVSMFFLSAHGESFVSEDARALQWWIDGSAVGDCDFLLLVNVSTERCHFSVATPDPGTAWRRIVDTCVSAEFHDNIWDADEPDEPVISGASQRWLAGHSVVVFQQVPYR